MKKTFIPFALTFLTFGFGCGFGESNGQSIKVKRNENSYEFEASYPKDRTARVVSFVENTLNQKQLFDENGIKIADLKLGDTLNFKLKARPGFIAIAFRKNENSFGAHQRLERLCMGIKEQLK